MDKLVPEEVALLEEELERMNQMFFLQMKIKGHLHPYKDDYFY